LVALWKVAFLAFGQFWLFDSKRLLFLLLHLESAKEVGDPGSCLSSLAKEADVVRSTMKILICN
jgi:hypothetical protein